ncbi:YidC/Oxa1 family membrane protein insertase [Cellulomonas triticagri]|uniref:Membrane protein insertase YidC n=1 Tax=Cellulomonas triticagri TaxID=2483352 RepID=A0A3M2JMR1_9CELL|nr:membrane protein insertase YidC [Cellulomonas triticagri]RMI12883.1 membrane protein insertase YidC [Cellulomonas triticagri]
MDLFALPPVAAALDAASRALMGLTHLLEPLAGTGAAALAVVLVTLLVRAALVPVGVSQARAERTRARLAPRLAEIQRRHRDDPERLQRATMALYREEGASPFAGCLPVLAQAPVVGLIYAVFAHPQVAGHGNDLLGQTLAGVPLGTGLLGSVTSGTATPVTLAVIGLVVLVVAAAGEVTRRAAAPGGRLAAPVAAGGAPGVGGGVVGAANPLAAPGMRRVLGALQFLTAVIACVVPLAAGLYLAVTVWWTYAQRVLLRRRYPLA